jgi:hypothetical protein
MRQWRSGRGARWALGLALAYAVVTLLAPAFHDAADCLGNSSQPCAACLANPPATQLAPQPALLVPELLRAAPVEPMVVTWLGALLPADTPGRAPPA